MLMLPLDFQDPGLANSLDNQYPSLAFPVACGEEKLGEIEKLPSTENGVILLPYGLRRITCLLETSTRSMIYCRFSGITTTMSMG